MIARQSGHTNMVKIEKWYPALNVNKLGTTVYTAHYADTFTTFKLTVNQKSETKMVLSSDNQTIKKGDTTFKLPEQAVIVSSNYRNVTVNVTWTPALDVNKVGTTVYTTEYNGIKAEFKLTVTAKGDVGTVKLNAVAEGVSNGKLVEYAFNYAGVYLDGNSFYGGPGANYTTNENGYVEFQIESGNHTVSVGKMTGSHWYSVSEIVNFEVNAGTSKEIKIVIPPSGAKIYANGNAGAGKAYYVTGQTKYLGEWATAYKMTYNNQTGKWETAKSFPIGAEFKIVRAAYTDADTISTKNVEWEKGSNHIITNTYAYGESINEFSPIF